MAKKKKNKQFKEGNAYPNSGNPGPTGGGLSQFLPAKGSDQFLLGAAIGAALTYVLSDEELRGKIIKSGIKLYTDLMGGIEEMKEQVEDIKAEIAAGQNINS